MKAEFREFLNIVSIVMKTIESIIDLKKMNIYLIEINEKIK